MPRRPPPTSLKLVTGPTPPRGKPKHTLPSIPRPAFLPSTSTSSVTPANAKPRAPSHERTLAPIPRPPHSRQPSWAATSDLNAGAEGPSPPLRRHSAEHAEDRATVVQTQKREAPKVRGPWDHSSSFTFQVDVEAMLPAPKKAAVSPV